MLYVFENYTLDPDRRELRRGSDVIAIEPQVFDLLEHLIRHRNRVVSRDDLIASVWGGRIVSESALSTRINAVRSAIGDDGERQRFIRTLPRKGFRFVGEVREVEEEEQSRARRATTLLSNTAATVAPRVELGTEAPAFAMPNKPSIAVLPFRNMSGDLGQDYFCDGVVEDIITGLSHIKWLFVIAHNSSFIYKGRAVDVKQVGRELGVRYILEGSVQKAADRVRVTGQLIDAETGAHVWAEHYDRKYDDIFALQDDITLSVVGTIEPSLRSAEIDRAKRKRPENLSAYDLVLQAHADTYTRMPAQSKRALVLLQRALALEPTYALAHAYAALCHHSIFLRDGMREEHRVASMRHAEAAITYGQDDATALSFAGFTIGMEGRDRATALSLFEHALSVSPSSAHTYICGSAVLAFGGQAERAIEWAARGLRLSPFDPWRASALVALALGHFHRGRFEDAVAAGRKAVQASPGFSIAYLTLAAPLATLGALDEAKAAAAKTLELQPGFRYGRHFASLAVAPDLAAALGDALQLAGLPE